MEVSGDTVRKKIAVITIVLLTPIFLGCSKYVLNDIPRYRSTKIFHTSFKGTWDAVLGSLEDHTIVTAERGSGLIVTGWAKGSSPLFVRKEGNPIFRGEKKWFIGAAVANIMPETVVVVHLDNDRPADKGGLKLLDVIQEVNGNKITQAVEFRQILRSGPSKITIKVSRERVKGPITLEITPEFTSSGFEYIPVLTRYRLSLHLTSEGEGSTEVRIRTEEEGIMGTQTRGGWTADYAKVERSSFREKLILDRVGQILSK